MPEEPIQTPKQHDASDNLTGGLWMAVSVVTAAIMTLAARGAAGDVDSIMIVTLRAIGGFGLAMMAVGAVPRLRGGLKFSNLKLHIARGALVAISTHLGFYTLTQIPLAAATVLFFTAPIITTVLAGPILGEHPGPRRIAAVIVGFLGVIVVMQPGVAPFHIAYVTALGSSTCFSMVLLMSRRMANADGPMATYLSSAGITVLISLPLATSNWHLPSTEWGWIAVALIVTSSLARNLADIQAYRLAEASFLAPIAYTRLIIIALGAYLLFDEAPGLNTWAGGAVIIAAALYIAHRERVTKRAQKR
ncbi:MAG: DMT family transporter [Pikeienuella sp.]